MLVLENLEPKPYDAVRGGQLPPPVGGVVLGGLAGVRHRLSSSVSEHRIAALKEAFNYGDAGLKIVIKICQSETGPVQRAACDLLRERLSAIAREKLQAFVPASLDSETAADRTQKILKNSASTVSEKGDRQLSEAQLIFETTVQQMEPNLLLLEALVASVEREGFTSELMNFWDLLILEIQEPLKELRQAVGSAISAQLRIQWQYNQSESQANQWQQRALLALQKGDENSVRQAWVRKQIELDKVAKVKIDLDDQTVRVETLNRNLLALESKIAEANSKKEILKMQVHFSKVQEQINCTFSQMNTIFFSP
ncbi:MAG: PspA/IM30 family protein [Microcoleus sp. PH2017_07_MST_O_A]|uniref:PspA/IM30 family protein n=1 Tax=Microcoleus sp. PH2017_05_CCC_O_A TaxID=2798816 RepID=UPI001E172C45|nr:PspA/IM30 family protein [Microcoleus sp. PH2017_05_CCC_O_A]MCC3420968.1 PspA/IM30 family protein [Microcoleus sp. PH2017_07_MST_O_A]MCC3512437.1 PspA/IM30 family protein [Microcoleus sp. PH2017_17_BER_D_A]TAG04573.1 MAG: PspA/IM30 family protein [Oscillatoriales cyanobacterium]MCC3435010.1 PspA/IM30 family protein [Microcoleus sp. PH2017_05_CCC_O_A]TAG13899.1 MAG: PspA/IM30 family protein [Oscillatoriales cyanobacterium]